MSGDRVDVLSESTDQCHEADHEWECSDGGYVEVCTQCGATRDYDGSEDDGRDFTEPYEP